MLHRWRMVRRVAILVVLQTAWCGMAFGLAHVVLKRDGQQFQVDGRLLLTARDGGVMLVARDGVIWTVQPAELVRCTTDHAPFEPLSADAMAREVLAELPKGFSVLQTPHYTICYNTSKEYAQWCGSLFEQLYRAFWNYWTRPPRGFTLTEPEFRLTAIVFADRQSYVKYTQVELGEAARSILGYFHLRTNRMTMCDLTGVEALSRYHGRRGSLSISQLLAQPEAERTVATVVHEATHQIAFNCGLHTRFSDCPRWFSEGVAMYFEVPDLHSAKGWRTIGSVNRLRLGQFQQYARRRPADSLPALLTQDKRFQDAKQGLEAYAEAWALTYFLVRQRPKQYIEYLRTLSAKKPMVWDTPEERLAEFTQAFGDLKRLDAEFLRYMGKVQ
jgi:hypothetical protein